jgi:hypothetical protein
LAAEAPIEGYGVVVPEWEIQLTPDSAPVVLNGTIEQVYDQLLAIDPSSAASFVDKRDERPLTTRFHKRSVFASHSCFGRWPVADYFGIEDGITHLRKVSGQPRNGPGPGNCGRVSCSWGNAIWWCNDVSFARMSELLGNMY